MGIKRVFAAGTLLLASVAFVPSPSDAASFDENVDWLGGELQTLFRGGKIDIDAFYEQLLESFTPEQANNVMDYLMPLLVKKDEDVDRCRYLFDDLREGLFEDDGTVNESAFNDELTGNIEEDMINAGCELALIEPGAGDETGVGDIPPTFLPPVDVCENGESCAGPDVDDPAPPLPVQSCEAGDVCGFTAGATLTAVPGAPIADRFNVAMALTIAADEAGPTGTTEDFVGETLVLYYSADPNAPFDPNAAVEFDRQFQETTGHRPGQAADLSVGVIAFGFNERQEGASIIQSDVIAAAFGRAADPAAIANLSNVTLQYAGTGVGSIDVNAIAGQPSFAGALGDVRIDTGHLMTLNASADGDLSGSYSIVAGSGADTALFGPTGLNGNSSTQVDIDLNSNDLAVTGNQFNAGNFAGNLSVRDGAIPGFSPVTVTDADGLGANVNGILTENGAVSSFDISVGGTRVSTGAAALGQVTN